MISQEAFDHAWAILKAKEDAPNYRKCTSNKCCGNCKAWDVSKTDNPMIETPVSYMLSKDLRRWFKEKWVDVGRKDKDGKHPPCGRSDADTSSRGYPKCRPSKKVSDKTPKTTKGISAKEKKAMTRRKRSKPQGVGGKPTMVKMCDCDNCVTLAKAFVIREELLKGKKEKPFHGYNPNRHSREGGLNAKGRAKFKREQGSNLKPPVTTKPSKLKPGSKKAKRRKSFCARMGGVKGPTSKGGKLTPKGAALKRWNC